MCSFTLFASVIEKAHILIFCSCKFVRVSSIIHDNPQIATVFIVRTGTRVFLLILLLPFPFPFPLILYPHLYPCLSMM